MELLPFLLVALVPPLALLFAPRKALRIVAAIAFCLAAFAVFWSWHLNETCSSDGCIGAGIATAFTVLFVVVSVIAGAVRWAIIDYKNRRDGGWGF